ncbi:MAG: hypothetical protein EBZ48_01475 [Proteobacteria bacterium]|nr:hypothetical protein [Pseudomonadota bacterium]
MESPGTMRDRLSRSVTRWCQPCLSMLVSGKPKLAMLVRGGAPQFSYIPSERTHDSTVAQIAARLLVSHQPTLSVVHLPLVDIVGHRFGWGSPQQVEAVSEADSAVAVVLKAFYGVHAGRPQYLILTSDHGGSKRNHGSTFVGSEHVPIILVGPTVRGGYDLTLSGAEIRVEDVFSTSCRLLGLEQPRATAGNSLLSLTKVPGAEIPRPHATRP